MKSGRAATGLLLALAFLQSMDSIRVEPTSDD